MEEVRDANKMLIGTFCRKTNTLRIQDRDKVRLIRIPREGLEVITCSGRKPPERTVIEPSAE